MQPTECSQDAKSNGSVMTQRIKLILLATLWLTTAQGILMLGSMPGDYGHFLCGGWG